MKLIVTQAFAGYERGNEINDPQAIEAILAGENRQFVVKVSTPGAAPQPLQPLQPQEVKEPAK